jgi:hypothetical protein
MDSRTRRVEGAAFATVTDYATVAAGPVPVEVVTADLPDGVKTTVELAAGSITTLLLLESDSPVSDIEAVVDAETATVLDDSSVLSSVADAASAPQAPAIGAVATGAGGTVDGAGRGGALRTSLAVLGLACLVGTALLAMVRRTGAPSS